MAPLHVMNSGISTSALAIGGTVLTGIGAGIGAFLYKIRGRIKNIFRKD